MNKRPRTLEEFETHILLRRGIEWRAKGPFEGYAKAGVIQVQHRPMASGDGKWHDVKVTPKVLLETSFMCPRCDPSSRKKALAAIKLHLGMLGVEFQEDAMMSNGKEVMRADLLLPAVKKPYGWEYPWDLVINYFQSSGFVNHTHLTPQAERRLAFFNESESLTPHHEPVPGPTEVLNITYLQFDEILSLVDDALTVKEEDRRI